MFVIVVLYVGLGGSFLKPHLDSRWPTIIGPFDSLTECEQQIQIEKANFFHLPADILECVPVIALDDPRFENNKRK